MTISVLVFNAKVFATLKHEGQMRKYGGGPYIEHPRRVAALVQTATIWTDDMVAAALLHDVIEDCGVIREELVERFGEHVAELVVWLTNDKDGIRRERKARECDRLSRAPRAAQTIKVCDIIDNIPDVVVNDPKFAPTFLAEKKTLLLAIPDADSALWRRAYGMILTAQVKT